MEKHTEEILDNKKTESGINIFDYLLVIAKNKKLILIPTVVLALATIIYTLLLPNTYISETTILLPQQNRSSGSGLLRQLGISGIEIGGDIQDPRLFQMLLKSDPVFDRIIDKFDLLKDEGTESGKAQAKEMLAGSVKTEFVLPEAMGPPTGRETSRLMRISVIAKDPQEAADMANAFVEELQNLLKSIAVSEASQKRLFFEEQLKQTTNDLFEAEEAMKKFQEETGMLKVDEQAAAVIDSIAKLRAELASKEVELMVMKTYSTPENPDLQLIEKTISGLKDELAKLEKKDIESSGALIATGNIPSVGLDYMRKLRALKFSETLYELVSKQYKMAMIEEAKDPSLIQVIAKAVPTQKRAGPQRTKKVLKVTAVTFIFFIFVAFVREFYERRKVYHKEDAEKLKLLKQYLRF